MALLLIPVGQAWAISGSDRFGEGIVKILLALGVGIPVFAAAVLGGLGAIAINLARWLGAESAPWHAAFGWTMAALNLLIGAGLVSRSRVAGIFLILSADAGGGALIIGTVCAITTLAPIRFSGLPLSVKIPAAAAVLAVAALFSLGAAVSLWRHRRGADAAYERAVQFHTQGRLEDAEREYRRALDADPRHTRAQRRWRALQDFRTHRASQQGSPPQEPGRS